MVERRFQAHVQIGIVASRLLTRLQRFAADGTFMGAWGGEGTSEGQFQSPAGVAVAGPDSEPAPDAAG